MNNFPKENTKVKTKKKIYTSPTLTKYGKVTEIIAGGIGSRVENAPNQDKRRP